MPNEDVQTNYQDIFDHISNSVDIGNNSLSSIYELLSQINDTLTDQQNDQITDSEMVTSSEYYVNSSVAFENMQNLLVCQLLVNFVLVGVVLALIFSNFWRFRPK